MELWFADERCVPPQDEQSNYRLVAETLLDGTDIPPESTHRMEGELGPEEGSSRYARQLCERVPAAGSGGLPVLDLVVLGIGPDGHVASLFPGAPTLKAGDEAVCLPVTRTRPSPLRSGSP